MIAAANEVLEHSAKLFEHYLWNSDIGASIQTRIARWGISEETMRSFGVGYSPGKSSLYLSELERFDLTPADALGAGMATESTRGHVHIRFHDRVMFPIKDREGTLMGFAGLATHLGPSWPLWIVSPDDGRFESGSALFGIDSAWPAIGREQKALIVRDCVQVLALHQDGRDETVAVVQSPITRAHTAQLGSAMGAGSVDFTRRDGYLGVVAHPAGKEIPLEAFASRSVPSGFSLAHSPHGGRARTAATPAAEMDELLPETRPWVFLAGAVVGFGVPIGLLLLAGPDGDETGAAAALNVVIVGVATTYLVLALLVSRVSARAQQRQTTRRMRLPWARGGGEVQPEGWTYHRLEEVLVGGALVSAAICIVLLMTIGGFLG